MPQQAPALMANAHHALYQLSLNENPYPPLPGVLEAMVDQLGASHRYPDSAPVTLTNELSHRLNAMPFN
jgi:histidinol-phosphate aminotransferase